MRRSVRLRPWQKRALTSLAAAGDRDYLAVATPGAGKTTFALTAAISDLTEHPGRRLAVVAPTQHLRVQWARAAAALGLHLAAGWSVRDGHVPGDMHGVVLTYQQVAADPEAVRRAVGGSFAIFDELHHAGEERAWGDALRHAFDGAARRLSLSGTPFRSDTHAIPFVRYDGDEATADFVYGYGDALAEGGVVRGVRFPRIDGEMEWTAPDGSSHAHTFADPLDRLRAGQRLRTALSLEGEWLPAVLDRANVQLEELRRAEPDAGGLVIAMDQSHARGIADLLQNRMGKRPVVAVSEDPDASDRISAFATSDDPWVVAVRMISEGVDIPRLRVGVFATNVVTELFFRQAVGRLVRWRNDGPGHPAHLFIPDDERLRAYAAQIAEQRRHSLQRPDRTPEDEVEDPLLAEEAALAAGDEDGQLSLFEAIRARAIGEPRLADWNDAAHGVPGATPAPVAHEPTAIDEGETGLLVDLAPPPLSAVGGTADTGGRTREERKKDLRDENARRARELARLTGRTHQEVNAELNRLAGVRRVTEATAEQLERRAAKAAAWMRKL